MCRTMIESINMHNVCSFCGIESTRTNGHSSDLASAGSIVSILDIFAPKMIGEASFSNDDRCTVVIMLIRFSKVG
jgi:hypothetical protein